MPMKAWEYRNIPFAERVRMHIVERSSGCLEFIGRRDTYGYGQIRDRGKTVLVHRWVWEQANGKTDLNVLHSCDNPSCVNLAHLHTGTHADNMREKKERGRCGSRPTGFAHKRPMAKLTNEKAVRIKTLLGRGYRQADIARDFNVSRSIVSDIATGKTWTHVTWRVK